MSQVHPLANFPFKVTLKDGGIKRTSLVSFTHGGMVSLAEPGGFHSVHLNNIAKIEIEEINDQRSAQTSQE